MNRYKIYCTEEQTKKALELGAPIEVTGRFEPLVNRKYTADLNNYTATIIPTAEEMIGWLEEQGVVIELAQYAKQKGWAFYINGEFYLTDGNSRKETTIEAIDAALDYLTKKIIL